MTHASFLRSHVILSEAKDPDLSATEFRILRRLRMTYNFEKEGYGFVHTLSR
jgi:hypothetical protein